LWWGEPPEECLAARVRDVDLDQAVVTRQILPTVGLARAVRPSIPRKRDLRPTWPLSWPPGPSCPMRSRPSQSRIERRHECKRSFWTKPHSPSITALSRIPCAAGQPGEFDASLPQPSPCSLGMALPRQGVPALRALDLRRGPLQQRLGRGQAQPPERDQRG